jgi:DMSO reductase anchor subunit
VSPRSQERQMVPDAEFRSYYGRPVLKDPAWETVDVAAYLFLGGLAGASSALAAAAHRTGYDDLAKVARITAGGAISGSAAALVHDLGRPARFLNMLRVFKVTSPMSMGSWLLAAYGPVAGVSAASAVTGKLPRAGRAAAAIAGAMGPAVATYTAALICNTAVPAWHDAHREMPYLFAGSAAAAAGGIGLLTLKPDRAVPAARLAVAGALTELAAGYLMERRLGPVAEPYRTGEPGELMLAARVLTATGAAAALAARGRSRLLSVTAGATLLAASAVTRFGVFHAGRASARDPKYTIAPQRTRAAARAWPPRE